MHHLFPHRDCWVPPLKLLSQTFRLTFTQRDGRKVSISRHHSLRHSASSRSSKHCGVASSRRRRASERRGGDRRTEEPCTDKGRGAEGVTQVAQTSKQHCARDGNCWLDGCCHYKPKYFQSTFPVFQRTQYFFFTSISTAEFAERFIICDLCVSMF